jgi:Na+-driven multidrug efflux pump
MVLAFIVVLALMIGVLIVGGNLIGHALGSKEWEDREPSVRQRALLRLLLATGAFVGLCWVFGELVKRVFR